ncbi:PRC-barrel domain-containing protein [Euzebya tangerina]|uniref:PRC-barrel domain-containing protein n=1 Tax=Euzebya tangerina TaxID=591198 RepID=UPI000E317DB1|nr:PRC-barrel domain-containing protein [Euzebya tangerina]
MTELLSLKSLRKRKVVDTATAETIGRVRAFQIDLDTASVAAVVVKGRPGGIVARTDVISFGPDAVTLPDSSVVIEDPGALPTDDDARGSRLLDETGRRLGKVEDMTMDAGGAVVSVTADGVSYEARLLGIGSYAVVISRV